MNRITNSQSNHQAVAAASKDISNQIIRLFNFTA